MTDRASTASKSTGPPDPLIGRVINERFKIASLIARGGMGKVYRAEQAPLGRVCAVKVLNPNYAGDHDPEFHKRFFLEASIASKLTHPNTVTIFDYGKTDDDVYYMAMEFLDGCTLHRAIRESKTFPEERAAHIARQICRALREAHALGVIHRDLKPANIFLVEHGDETDFVKVLDFGLVKNVSGDGKGEDLTQTGLFMGSPKYMAPEQIRGDRVDARTDIYSLGIILYEMLTGKVPFDRPNSVNILMAHVNEEPPPMRQMNPNINLSAATEETVARCMAKNPDERFRSMDEVLAALKRVGGAALTATVSGAGIGDYRSLSASGSGPLPPHSFTPSSGAHMAGAMGSGPVSIPSPLGTPSDSPASGSSLLSAPPPRSSSKATIALAAVAVLAVAGAAGWVAIHQEHPAAVAPPSTPSAAPSEAVPSASTPPADSVAAPPAFAKVRVSSTPSGASVREDGAEICSGTPCDIPYKGPDADPAHDHKLTFVKSGFKEETRTVHAGDPPLNVTLAAAPAQWHPPPVAKPADTPTVPQGYKPDIPY